jgi:hypothetical protein
MTEAECLVSSEPVAMLRFLRGKTTERKQRLFACACCLGMWEQKPDDLAYRAVTYGEHWAEIGASNRVEGRAIWDAIMELQDVEMHEGDHQTALKLIYSLSCLEDDPLFLFTRETTRSIRDRLFTLPRRMLARLTGPGVDPQDSLREQAKPWYPIIRCIFCNPFRPVAFDPNWRTTTSLAIAQQMYDSRDFAAMPILADALQDAGCDNTDILDHCRGASPHVRGCWVVDLVLGNE